MKIPLCVPYLDKKELKAVKEVLDSGWLTEGPKNKEFEEEFAKYIGTKYAVSLNSCASALQLGVEALGIKGEIILPSFSHTASANAIVNAGAIPVFTDIDYDTCNIDPKKIEEKITKNTQAIMPVHFAGQGCQMDKIMKIARKHKLAIIEDSAETIGGTFKKKMVGSFDIGCFSFFPTKNIAIGEGGMVTTNNKDLAQKIKTLAGHGIPKTTLQREKITKPWYRAATMAGYNFRMTNIQAAIGIEQMKKLNRMNILRRKYAAYLNHNLRNLKNIDLPVESKSCKHVYQMYTIKLKKGNRDEFVMKLRDAGIGASVHFDPPIHLQPFYKKTYKYKVGDFPITEKVAKSIVTLPMYPGLTQEQLAYIVKTIKKSL